MNRPERTGEYKRIDFSQFDIYSRRKSELQVLMFFILGNLIQMHPQLSLVPIAPTNRAHALSALSCLHSLHAFGHPDGCCSTLPLDDCCYRAQSRSAAATEHGDVRREHRRRHRRRHRRQGHCRGRDRELSTTDQDREPSTEGGTEGGTSCTTARTTSNAILCGVPIVLVVWGLYFTASTTRFVSTTRSQPGGALPGPQGSKREQPQEY